MAFVHKRPLLAAAPAVIATTLLLLAGNGMNPVWPLMWIAFVPVMLLAAPCLWAVLRCCITCTFFCISR
jgi:hypothetical protein